MSKKPIKVGPYYSDSFKLGVIRRIVNGEISKEQARREYEIGGKTTVLKWMRKFGYCTDSFTQPIMAEPYDDKDPKELQKKVQLLENQLQNERIRSEFLQTMIDVAERELGINIRKKSDTNPSD